MAELDPLAPAVIEPVATTEPAPILEPVAEEEPVAAVIEPAPVAAEEPTPIIEEPPPEEPPPEDPLPPAGGTTFDPLREFNVNVVPTYSDVPLMPEVELEILITTTMTTMDAIYAAAKAGGDSPGSTNEWEGWAWWAGHQYYNHVQFAASTGQPVDAEYLATLDGYIITYAYKYVEAVLNDLYDALVNGTTPPPDGTTPPPDGTTPPPDGTVPPPDGTVPPPDGTVPPPPSELDPYLATSYRVGQEVLYEGQIFLVAELDLVGNHITLDMGNGEFKVVSPSELALTVRTGQDAATELVGAPGSLNTTSPTGTGGDVIDPNTGLTVVPSTSQTMPLLPGITELTTDAIKVGMTFHDAQSGMDFTIIGLGHAPGTYRVKYNDPRFEGQTTDLSAAFILTLMKMTGGTTLSALSGGTAGILSYAAPSGQVGPLGGAAGAAFRGATRGPTPLAPVNQVFQDGSIGARVATGFSTTQGGRGLTAEESTLLTLVSSLLQSGNYNANEINSIVGASGMGAGRGPGIGAGGGGAIGDYLQSAGFKGLLGEMGKAAGAPSKEDQEPFESRLAVLNLPGQDNWVARRISAEVGERLLTAFETAFGRPPTGSERILMHEHADSWIEGSGRAWAKGFKSDMHFPGSPRTPSKDLQTFLANMDRPGNQYLRDNFLSVAERKMQAGLSPAEMGEVRWITSTDEEGNITGSALGPPASKITGAITDTTFGQEFEKWLYSRGQAGISSEERDEMSGRFDGVTDPSLSIIGKAPDARKLRELGFGSNTAADVISEPRLRAFLAHKYGIPLPVSSNYVEGAVNVYANSVKMSGDTEYADWLLDHSKVVADALSEAVSLHPEYGIGNVYDLAQTINTYIAPTVRQTYEENLSSKQLLGKQVAAARSLGATPFGLANKDPYDVAINQAVANLGKEYDLSVAENPAMGAKPGARDAWIQTQLGVLRTTMPSRDDYFRMSQDGSLGAGGGGGGGMTLGMRPPTENSRLDMELSDVPGYLQSRILGELQGQVAGHRTSYRNMQRQLDERTAQAIREYSATGKRPPGMAALPSEMTQRMMGLPSADAMIRSWMARDTPATFEHYLDMQSLDVIIPGNQVTITYIPRRI